MNKDTRVPTSTSQNGKYTVRVYSEELYLENKEQYFPEKTTAPTAPTAPQKKYKTFPKKRAYGWYGTHVHTRREEKGIA
jgi:hypothetical protein